MQYPVPQFTDVEDRIIGPLTLKQFGIIFAAGMFIVLIYSATKDLVVLALLVLFVGVPAIGIAFGKFNGRPVYNTFPVLLNYILAPKLLVFHKEAMNFSDNTKLKNVDLQAIEVQKPQIRPHEDPKAKLKELNRLLQQQAERERQLVKQIK